MVTSTSGEHKVWRTGDIVWMQCVGPISRADMESMRMVTRKALDELGRCFLLADLSACSGIEVEARKYMAQWSKDYTDQLSGTAVYGFNFAMRVIVTLTINAIRFLGTQQVDVVFKQDRADALLYCEERRVELGVAGDLVSG